MSRKEYQIKIEYTNQGIGTGKVIERVEGEFYKTPIEVKQNSTIPVPFITSEQRPEGNFSRFKRAKEHALLQEQSVQAAKIIGQDSKELIDINKEVFEKYQDDYEAIQQRNGVEVANNKPEQRLKEPLTDTQNAQNNPIFEKQNDGKGRLFSSGKKKTAKTFFTAMTGALLGSAIFWGGAQFIPASVQNGTPSSSQQTTIAEKTANYTDVSTVVQKVTPGVVTVLVGDRMMNLTGSGSGVVYHSENGKVYILTNAHVVSDATNIKVYRNDLGEEKTDVAKILAIDTLNDIAVLEVAQPKNEYPVVIDFADASTLQLGQKVVAVGSPLGSTFSGSVTEGIISGLDRKIAVDAYGKQFQTFIQTDAAINGGNSGGALIDMDGNLVGINSAKISSADNIGLAIPSNIVLEVLEKLDAPLPTVE